MSGLWGWFGGGAAANPKNAPKNAIIDLRATLEMLQKREKYLTSQAEEQQAIARKNVNSNPTLAKTALRRKKTHEHSLDQTISQITTIEQQINAIESANINRETLAAMERASKAMSQIHGKLTPEKVDATMAKLADANALSEEIVSAMNSVNVGQVVDDDELDEELANLQQEQLDKELLKTGTVPVSDAVQRLPAAGAGEIKASPQPAAAISEEDDDEAELRKLRAEMAI